MLDNLELAFSRTATVLEDTLAVATNLLFTIGTSIAFIAVTTCGCLAFRAFEGCITSFPAFIARLCILAKMATKMTRRHTTLA